MLRVGVDGRNINNKFDGISRYTLNLLIELQKKDIEIFIFTQGKVDPAIRALLYKCNFVSAVCHFGIFEWLFLILPKQLVENKINVFWGPSHRLPLRSIAQIPTILTIHDLVFKRRASSMRFRNYLGEFVFFKRAIKKASSIICVSDFTRRELINFYPWVYKKTTVLYPGSNFSTIKPKLIDYLTPFQGQFLLSVGTNDPRKNIENLLIGYSALSHEMRSRHPMVIVGGDGWGGSLRKIAKNYKILDTTYFIGTISDSYLKWLYENTLLLCYASCYEGFGLPALEAMSCGKRSMILSGTAMAEFVGEYGVYSESSSAVALGEILNCYVSRWSNKLVQDLIPYSDERFTWEFAAEKLYEKITKAH